MMTSRQRVMAVLNREIPDRLREQNGRPGLASHAKSNYKCAGKFRNNLLPYNYYFGVIRFGA